MSAMYSMDAHAGKPVIQAPRMDDRVAQHISDRHFVAILRTHKEPAMAGYGFAPMEIAQNQF